MTKKYVEGNQYNPDIYRSDLDHWQDGEYTVYRTTQWTAPGCHDGCGILCYVNKEGKLEKVEGDPANGYSRGALCMRCLDLVEAMYAEDRLKYPMKRACEDRGKDAWERITWEEAFDLIEEKVRYFQQTYGAGSIVVQQGTGRNTTFFHSTALCYVGFDGPVVGHRRVSVQGGSLLWAARLRVMALMAGCFLVSGYMSQALPERFELPRLRAARVHPRVGKRRHRVEPGRLLGTLDGGGHEAGQRAGRRGPAPHVDGRQGRMLAARCDRPAGAALAVAIANVIDAEGLVDHDFIDRWGYGYETFIEGCRTMSAGEGRRDLLAGRRGHRGRRPLHRVGQARVRCSGALKNWTSRCSAPPLPATTILGIVAMTGNVDVPGGNLLMVDHAFNLALSTGSNWRFVPEDQRSLILGNNRYPMHKQGDVGNMAQEDVVLEALESDGKVNDVDCDFPLKMFVLYSTNPISNMATEAPRIYDAMVNHSEFNVDINYVLTPSAMAYCELVLPIAMGPERNSLRAWWWPLRVIRKAADRYYECEDGRRAGGRAVQPPEPGQPHPRQRHRLDGPDPLRIEHRPHLRRAHEKGHRMAGVALPQVRDRRGAL